MREIKIRRFRPSDVEKLCSVYAYFAEKTAVTFEDKAPSPSEFGERIKKIVSFYPCFVAECGGEAVGFCYAGTFKNRSAYDWSVETTIYVAKDYARLSIGSQLYAALEEALRSQGIKNMYACIAYPAEEDEYLTYDSVRFHEKLGFKTVGRFSKCGNKFGRWYDMVWMEKFISRHNPDPRRPLPYSECVDASD